MIFARKGASKSHLKKFNLNINKNHIEQVSLFIKYLGVHLDNKLSWQEHINILQTKLSKFSGLVFHLRTFVPKNVIIMLYNALVGSHLRYGITSWGSSASYSYSQLGLVARKYRKYSVFFLSKIFSKIKLKNVFN